MPNDPQPRPMPEVGTPEWDEMMQQLTAVRTQQERAAPVFNWTMEDWATQRPMPGGIVVQPADMEGGAIDPGTRIPDLPPLPTQRVGGRLGRPTATTATTPQRNPFIAVEQPRQPRVRIEAVEIRGAHTIDRGVEYLARFTERGGLMTDLAIMLYPDVGRATQPYATALMQQIATEAQNALGLPRPRVPQLPNATIAERMYNMLALLMDRDGTEAMQNEWETLRMEYENYMEGRF